MNRVKNVIIGVFTTYLCFRLLVPQAHVSAWASPYIRACFACLQGGPLRSIVRGLAMYLTLAFAVRLVLYESSFTPTPAGLPKQAQKSHIGSNHKDQIETGLYRRSAHLFNLDVDLVLWDTTTTYFYGQRCESLARYGFSKDKRPDMVQIMIGVMLTRDGFPTAGRLRRGGSGRHPHARRVSHGP